jgi:hypothetical protein
MSFCTACGHERTGPGQFCTACGAALAPEPDAATPLATAPAPPGPGGLSPSGGPPDVLAAPPRRRGRAGIIATVTALVVLAAGGGAAAWLRLRHHHVHAGPPAIAQSSGPGRADNTFASPLPSALAPTPLPALTPSPAPASPAVPAPVASGGASILTLAPGAGQDPRAVLVESFLNRYFAAINGHDYQQYRALLDRKLQRDESAQAFTSGYSSTTDSAATLNSISSLGGEVGAAVTFTSHQDPSQSPTGAGCTDWSITLYLTIHGGRYLLGPAPAAYRAGFQGC